MDESTVKQENVMELLVKFVPLVILKEKNLLKQRKHKNENIRDWKRNCRCNL